MKRTARICESRTITTLSFSGAWNEITNDLENDFSTVIHLKWFNSILVRRGDPCLFKPASNTNILPTFMFRGHELVALQ